MRIKNRYGFISVDLENNGQRTIKKSGYWFNEVSKNNGFNGHIKQDVTKC